MSIIEQHKVFANEQKRITGEQRYERLINLARNVNKSGGGQMPDNIRLYDLYFIGELNNQVYDPHPPEEWIKFMKSDLHPIWEKVKVTTMLGKFYRVLSKDPLTPDPTLGDLRNIDTKIYMNTRGFRKNVVDFIVTCFKKNNS